MVGGGPAYVSDTLAVAAVKIVVQNGSARHPAGANTTIFTIGQRVVSWRQTIPRWCLAWPR
jgi:hypothetical protein